jgi:hypothetical protein
VVPKVTFRRHPTDPDRVLVCVKTGQGESVEEIINRPARDALEAAQKLGR